MKGLEPILLTEPDPKSGAATNYATSAFFECAKLQKFLTPYIINEKYYFLTLRASRSALPMSMKASTSNMMAMPGSTAK